MNPAIRQKLIKVEAIETSDGITAGMRVKTLPRKMMNGENMPVVTGTVRRVLYVCDYSMSYYRLDVICDDGQEFRALEATQNTFALL